MRPIAAKLLALALTGGGAAFSAEGHDTLVVGQVGHHP